MPKKNGRVDVGKKSESKKKGGGEKGGITLQELLVMHLKALYDVESQLVKALPKMAKKADNEDLRRGFERHARQTEGHVGRIERVFDILEAKPQKVQAAAIRGLITDVEMMAKNVKDAPARDAGLIAAAQCVEYYEIAGYDTAIAWAKLLDLNDIADMLQETLDEEQETSDEMMELATTEINDRAAGEGVVNDDDTAEEIAGVAVVEKADVVVDEEDEEEGEEDEVEEEDEEPEGDA